MGEKSIAIIGAGVGGLNLARKLRERGHEEIYVIEKGAKIGNGQSGHNSGVIHCGVYYTPGSLKAQLSVEGKQQLYKFCQKHDVPVQRTGKLIVATTPDEVLLLQQLLDRAQANGVHLVREINGEALPAPHIITDLDEIQSYEPNVHGLAALHMPTTGIIEPAQYLERLVALASNQIGSDEGARILWQTEVTDVTGLENNEGFEIEVKRRDGRKETMQVDILVNAAGTYTDDIALMFNSDFPYRIVPTRGEYFTFSKTARSDLHMNGMNVYPTPVVDGTNACYVSVGVHATPLFEQDRSGNWHIGRTVLMGPTSKPVQGKEDYDTNRFGPDHFLKRTGYLPTLVETDLAKGPSGIRAKMTKNGQPHREFVMEQDGLYKNAVHWIMDSPGLTASIAAAEYMADIVDTLM